MGIELDHATVPARDRRVSAELLACLLGVSWADAAVGPFCAVYVNDGLTLDFDSADGPFPVQHYASIAVPYFARRAELRRAPAST